MSKYTIFNKEDLSKKILELLKVKDVKLEIEAEINNKIKEFEKTLQASIADTPKLAEICLKNPSDSSYPRDFKLDSQSISTQSGVIEHYIKSLVGSSCLGHLGWKFTLNSSSFQDTILHYPESETIKQTLNLLYCEFGRYIEKMGELKSITKIKVEAFSFYATTRIVAEITNLLYRLTNQDKYFVWMNHFDQFENEFMHVTSKGEYIDDENITLLTFTFTDDALNLLNEAFKRHINENKCDNIDEDYF